MRLFVLAMPIAAMRGRYARELFKELHDYCDARSRDADTLACEVLLPFTASTASATGDLAFLSSRDSRWSTTMAGYVIGGFSRAVANHYMSLLGAAARHQERARGPPAQETVARQASGPAQNGVRARVRRLPPTPTLSSPGCAPARTLRRINCWPSRSVMDWVRARSYD